MKEHRLFFILICVFVFQTSFGMELPPERTAESIVTAKGERIRLHLLQRVFVAIRGEENQENIEPDEIDDPAILHASPQSWCKVARRKCEEHFVEVFKEKGITPEMVAARIPDVKEEIQDLTIIEEQYSPAPSPMRKEFAEVARKMNMPVPDLRKASTGDIAYARGDKVVYDPDLLERVAPTPGRRKAVWGHELAHIANDDLPCRYAHHKASVHGGKESALSPETKQQLARFQEAFADLETATQSPSSASSHKRLWQSFTELDGDGVAGDHPSNKARLNLSQAVSDLHKEHQEELERKKALRARSRKFNEDIEKASVAEPKQTK